MKNLNLPELPYKMPVLFMGHGSPMNAIEENEYTIGWAQITKDIPEPKAILVISAHWETKGTRIFTGEHNHLLFDMYGFPKPLYNVQYTPPGAPQLALEVTNQLRQWQVHSSETRGLDHGAWSVLIKMYPDASIPCFQMSLNRSFGPPSHYELGRELLQWRKRGVLVLASGNIVHNLSFMAQMNLPAPDWALDFDHFVEEKIIESDHQALVEYHKFGAAARTSVNSAEHYLPLLYCLAMREREDSVVFFNQSKGGSLMDLLMRCVKIG